MKNLERDNLNLRLCRHRHFQTGQITTLSERRWQRYLHLARDQTEATPSPLELLDFPRTSRS